MLRQSSSTFRLPLVQLWRCEGAGAGEGERKGEGHGGRLDVMVEGEDRLMGTTLMGRCARCERDGEGASNTTHQTCNTRQQPTDVPTHTTIYTCITRRLENISDNILCLSNTCYSTMWVGPKKWVYLGLQGIPKDQTLRKYFSTCN